MVGFLKRKMDYGIFVNVLNNLTGLAPNKVPCKPLCEYFQLFSFRFMPSLLPSKPLNGCSSLWLHTPARKQSNRLVQTFALDYGHQAILEEWSCNVL